MGIRPSDLVYEVGPGRGALTEHLVRRSARLIAVEIDADLAEGLRSRYMDDPAVEVIGGDFLALPVPAGARVATNLPFSITADAIRHLAASEARDAHLIMQRDAALRFAGEPWAPESRFSLLLKPWWHFEILRALHPTDFDPPPRVQCVFTWMARLDPPLVTPHHGEAYRRFIDTHFGRERTLRAALRPTFTRAQIERLRQDLHLDLDAPPSAASFSRWLALFRASSSLDRGVGRRRACGGPRTPPAGSPESRCRP